MAPKPKWFSFSCFWEHDVFTLGLFYCPLPPFHRVRGQCAPGTLETRNSPGQERRSGPSCSQNLLSHQLKQYVTVYQYNVHYQCTQEPQRVLTWGVHDHLLLPCSGINMRLVKKWWIPSIFSKPVEFFVRPALLKATDNFSAWPQMWRILRMGVAQKLIIVNMKRFCSQTSCQCIWGRNTVLCYKSKSHCSTLCEWPALECCHFYSWSCQAVKRRI